MSAGDWWVVMGFRGCADMVNCAGSSHSSEQARRGPWFLDSPFDSAPLARGPLGTTPYIE
jgi:hypothetical protein